jgi:hypothetical protein
MSDPDTLVISSGDSQDIFLAIRRALPQLPPEVRGQLLHIGMVYKRLHGLDGLYERVNNRTVSSILQEFGSSGEDSKPIATGEVGDTRYTLFEAPQKKHGSEESGR